MKFRLADMCVKQVNAEKPYHLRIPSPISSIPHRHKFINTNSDILWRKQGTVLSSIMKTIINAFAGLLFLLLSSNCVAQTNADSTFQNHPEKIKSISETVELNQELLLEEKIITQRNTDIEDKCSFLTLNNLARAARSIDNNKAFECITNFLAYQELVERSQLFNQLAENLSI